MKAQKVNESLGDVLKPKSSEEIKQAIRKNPLEQSKAQIRIACEAYWKKIGIRFGKITDPRIVGYEVEGHNWDSLFTWDSIKISEGKFFIPEYAGINGDMNSVYNQLYGRFILTNGKFSNSIIKIVSITIG